MKKKAINIIWFKRDFRFADHEPLYFASLEKEPLLLLYCFEPSVMNYGDSSARHWRFIYQSIQDLQLKLNPFHATIYIFRQEVATVFKELIKIFDVKKVLSYQEIGNKITYDRDIFMHQFFKENTIIWNEFQTNGIVRKLKSRSNWDKKWNEAMHKPIHIIDLQKITFVSIPKEKYHELKGNNLNTEITTKNPNFQPGGETKAWQYFQSFLQTRYQNYSKHISKPLLSRKSCSRLSPYLTYGNISMRMVFQTTMQVYKTSNNKRALANFISRLHWHCHFIQKFEDECLMEFENVNRAYDILQKPKNETYIKAWQEGKTGVPIVDACVRCLIETGYINFRMRAMIVSFFTFNLWQDWRELHFLAQQFLDYEPGIHYPQLQMQSGTTGINIIRVYNPIKNSEDHDSEGLFIKKWIPELENVPTQFIHEPWKMTLIDQQLYNCVIGTDYPEPIVNIEETRKKASEIMWSFRKNDAVKQEGKRILNKHVTNPNKPKNARSKKTKSAE